MLAELRTHENPGCRRRRSLGEVHRKGLEEEHYAVDIVHDGEQARGMACESDYDLVILDLNLPGMDGISILQRLRHHKRLPVLILTGRTRLEDRIRALDLGADDCVLKPFSFAELSARVRALLRRGSTTHVDLKLRVADLELDRVQRTVARAGKRIELTSKEFALLEYLMRNAGRRVTRTMIIEHVWNLKFDSGTNVVDVYVNNLTTAEDGIRSADIGQSVANLTKYNILSSTGISALAQANQMQQSVLKLLQ
jgi:two-component system copper resistance phosphate regulon response regulator CusR